MKFIHAGDLHVDSALSGLSAHDEAPLDLLRGATRRAFTNIVDRALSEKVAFLLLPGDLFDTGWRDFGTGIFFMRQVARLHAAGIAVIVVRGNHDPAEEMLKTLSPPPNLHILSAERPETLMFNIDGLPVAIHGQSFRTAATYDNLASGYTPTAGHLNIALLHTSLGGYDAHAPYAPCSLDELVNKGMDYWALGHVHEHAVLATKPYVAFSGNAQGRHAAELGPRGALLCAVAHGVVQAPQRIYTDVLRWQIADVDASGAHTVDEVMARVYARFESLMGDADGRPVACRVRITGKTAAHRELASQPRAVRQNVQAQAMYVDAKQLWVEKIEVATTPPRDAAEIAARADGIAELQTLLSEAGADAEFMASLRTEFGPLLAKLPREVLGDSRTLLSTLDKGDFAALVTAVAPDVLDRVEQER